MSRAGQQYSSTTQCMHDLVTELYESLHDSTGAPITNGVAVGRVLDGFRASMNAELWGIMEAAKQDAND